MMVAHHIHAQRLLLFHRGRGGEGIALVVARAEEQHVEVPVHLLCVVKILRVIIFVPDDGEAAGEHAQIGEEVPVLQADGERLRGAEGQTRDGPVLPVGDGAEGFVHMGDAVGSQLRVEIAGEEGGIHAGNEGIAAVHDDDLR